MSLLHNLLAYLDENYGNGKSYDLIKFCEQQKIKMDDDKLLNVIQMSIDAKYITCVVDSDFFEPKSFHTYDSLGRMILASIPIKYPIKYFITIEGHKHLREEKQ